MEKKISIIILDDKELARIGIKSALEDIKDFKVLTCVPNKEKLMIYLASNQPDILLLDMEINGKMQEGISIAKEVKRRYPKIKIIIISAYFNKPFLIAGALEKGVEGYLDNTVEGYLSKQLKDAIFRVFKGENNVFNQTVLSTIVDCFISYVKNDKNSSINKTLDDNNILIKQLESFKLDNDELAIIKYLAEGYSNEEIYNDPKKMFSEKMHSERSLENIQKSHIAKKLGVKNDKTLIIIKSLKEGLLSLDDIDLKKYESLF
jgi:two-component system, NarL family, captular synthesis response regulator RcsB